MKSFFLLTILFVLISFFTLGVGVSKKFKNSKASAVSVSEKSENVLGEYKYVSVPVVKDNVEFPEVSADSALIVDLETNVILYDKNKDLPVFPASTTKIITALVAMDKYPLDIVLTVGDINVDGQKMGLIKGERISVENLLYGLLVASGNDAAEVLAQNYLGGRRAFIDAMNLKAEELGMSTTFFENPTGFDNENQITTASDLVKVAYIAMQRPFFRKVVGTKEITIESEDGKFTHKLVNINELVGEVDGVMGVKTGWTENAQENLVTYIVRDDSQDLNAEEKRKIMIVVLGSGNRFGETRKLIDWVFESYEWKERTGVASKHYLP